jgi:hypothetical protein
LATVALSQVVSGMSTVMSAAHGLSDSMRIWPNLSFLHMQSGCQAAGSPSTWKFSQSAIWSAVQVGAGVRSRHRRILPMPADILTVPLPHQPASPSPVMVTLPRRG